MFDPNFPRGVIANGGDSHNFENLIKGGDVDAMASKEHRQKIVSFTRTLRYDRKSRILTRVFDSEGLNF
jgi:hypothetical protein